MSSFRARTQPTAGVWCYPGTMTSSLVHLHSEGGRQHCSQVPGTLSALHSREGMQVSVAVAAWLVAEWGSVLL